MKDKQEKQVEEIVKKEMKWMDLTLRRDAVDVVSAVRDHVQILVNKKIEAYEKQVDELFDVPGKCSKEYLENFREKLLQFEDMLFKPLFEKGIALIGKAMSNENAFEDYKKDSKSWKNVEDITPISFYPYDEIKLDGSGDAA